MKLLLDMGISIHLIPELRSEGHEAAHIADLSTGTRPFEDVVGFFAQQLHHTTVAELVGIAWATVGEIARRLVAERFGERRFEEWHRIGVDEIRYGRHHRFRRAPRS